MPRSFFALLALCVALVSPVLAAGKAPVLVSLLAINDFHGALHPPAGTVALPDTANPASVRVAAGGASYLASLVRALKGKNPDHTLVVGAGDLVGAAPLTSGWFHDEPTIEVLNQIGMDVSSVGNHEFDKGRDELLRLQNGGCFAPSVDGTAGQVGVDTCMQAGKFAGAGFQYLAANVIDNRTGTTLLPAIAVRQVGDVKVGFIGVTLRSTPSVVIPSGVAGLQFLGEVATVNAWVPQLRQMGAAVIVVLVHQGGQTRARTVQDKTCPEFSGPILALADQFDSAVDVVVSGHTHQEYVCVRPDGKLVTQAGSQGRMVSKIDLLVDVDAKRVVGKDANNWVVVNGQGAKGTDGGLPPLPQGVLALPPDPQVAAIVRRYGDLAAPLSDMVVGRLAQPLGRKTNAAGESALGAVIADAYLAGASDTSNGARPARIAFTNPGGLRSDLGAGLTVTFGQLFNVLPFNNHLVSMDLTGEQILRLLEQQWERPQSGEGRVLPVSQGFQYTWDARQPAGAPRGKGRRVVPGSMQLHGVPLDMKASYRVVVNNYMATGGDRLNVLRHGTQVQDGENDLVAAKLYFRLKGVVTAPTAPRIVRLH